MNKLDRNSLTEYDMNNMVEIINGVDVHAAIVEMCKKRDYKCKGCPYSIKKLAGFDTEKQRCCIFASCPCDWED